MLRSVTNLLVAILAIMNSISVGFSTPSMLRIVFNPPSRPFQVGPDLSQVDSTVNGFTIYLPAIAWTPPDQIIYSDNFDNGNLGWQADFPPGGEAGVVNGYYRLYHSYGMQFLTSLAPLAANQLPSAGYVLQVTTTLTQGSDGRLGLVFDSVQYGTSFQILIISPLTQHYWVYRYENRAVKQAVVSGISASINPGLGSNNLVRLVRRSDKIQIYINGNAVTDLVDDPIANNGLVGLQLTVYSSTPGEGHFDNFDIFKLP